MPQIAFAGLGRIGLPMCAALVSAGYQVTATDERAEAEEAAVACGATWQDTPAQAAAAAGVLITMLPGPREVHAAMLGEAGALKGPGAGAAWIDMTSNSPVAVRPIREQAIEKGVEVLEAPVGGGTAAAREGTLQLFVGGEASAVERHRALLEVLGDPGGSSTSAGTAPGTPPNCWSTCCGSARRSGPPLFPGCQFHAPALG